MGGDGEEGGGIGEVDGGRVTVGGDGDDDDAIVVVLVRVMLVVVWAGW